MHDQIPTLEHFTATGTPVAGINPDDALQVLGVGVSRGEWLVMRRTGLGGSDVSALVGLNRYTSPYELWEDKTGRLLLVDEPSEAAEMGILLEPVIRDRFARLHGMEIRQVGTLRSSRWPWMLANPDGICADGYGYEGKTCSQWLAHEWGTDSDPQVPDHAELQAQWCMAVTGLQGWWVACLIGGQHNVARLVRRDEQIIADLASISGQFWHEHVIADEPPAVDGSPAVTELLVERYRVAVPGSEVEIDQELRDELVVAREKAAAAKKAAEAEVDEVKNRVRQLLGSAERLVCDGAPVATWKHTSRFSTKQFRAAHPDLASRYEKAAVALDTERLASEHPGIYREFCSRDLRFAG